MAFGKDQSRINALGGSWSQRAKNHATSRPRSGGGGGGFHWKGNYDPVESPNSDVIRIFDAQITQSFVNKDQQIIEDSLPFFKFREHRDSKKKSCICSAGPLFGVKGQADPCPSCDVFWADIAEQKAMKVMGSHNKAPRRMSCHDQYAWFIYDYGPYTETYDIDRNSGQFRMDSKTNKPFTSWEKGDPRDPRFNGRVVSYKTGMLLPWVLSHTTNNWLQSQSELIGQNCGGCGNRASLICEAKVCANCSNPVYDPNNSTLTPEQRSTLDNNPHACSRCQHVGYLAEVLRCRACNSPRRQTIFEIDLQMTKIRTGEKQTVFQIINYSEPRPLQVAPEVLSEIQGTDIAAKFAKFGPTPPDTQRKYMTLPAAQPQLPQAPMGQTTGQPGVTSFQPGGFQPQGMAPAFNPTQFGAPATAPVQQPQAPLQQPTPFSPPSFGAIPFGQTVSYGTPNK